jgi:hypothetical protein
MSLAKELATNYQPKYTAKEVENILRDASFLNCQFKLNAARVSQELRTWLKEQGFTLTDAPHGLWVSWAHHVTD